MIARLAQDSKLAQPTPFHRMLRSLDDRGRLLRVYSQNIDALEQKAGLTFGVPEPEVKRYKPRSSKGSPDTPDGQAPHPSSSAVGVGRLPTPPAETPRCIPLHGTLQNMHCQICLHSFPLENYLEDLNEGELPICPECSQMEETRQAIGKRSRGVGKLRPSVVLYNELHKDGEEVGEVVQRDLLGGSKGKGRTGADLLIVVGTSLRVPGTKRMVREFSKAIHSRSAAASASQSEASSSSQPSPSPRAPPSRSSSEDDDTPIKTIYLNLDFPVPTREWEGVFDVWLRGDAQEFAKLVQDEIEREEKAKEAAIERRRRREETKAEAALAAQAAEEERARAEAQSKAKGKQKENGKKAKVSSKPHDHVTLGKRKASTGSAERPAKRPKLHASSDKVKSMHSKVKTRVPTKKEKLTVKFPGQLWSKVTSQKRRHRILTPPPSQKRLKAEVIVPPRQSSFGSLSPSRLSSPLTTPTTSPQIPPFSGFSSPLSQLSSMSSCLGSPQPSPLPSPSLLAKACSPMRRNAYLGMPPTPDDSPLSSPPPTRMPSTAPSPLLLPNQSARRLSMAGTTLPTMRRRSSSFNTMRPYMHEEDIDIEGLSDTEDDLLSESHIPHSLRRSQRPGLRSRLPTQR